MARIFRGGNHLSASAARNRAAGICCFLPLVVYFYFGLMGKIFFSGLLHFLPLLLCGFPAGWFFRRYARFQAGLAGEKRCLTYARQLPDSYFVFTNVRLFHENRRTEIDVVIVGERGVFVVEVKNHAGVITGRPAEEYWQQSKNAGRAHARPMRNPVKQVRRQAYILSQAVRAEGAGVWVESAVLFVNPAVKVDVVPGPVVVLDDAGQLYPFVMENKGAQALEEDTVKRVADIVRRLQKRG